MNTPINPKFVSKIANLKKEVGKLTKNSTNPFFKSKYFDINALLEHLEPLCETHGLIILQPILEDNVTSQIIDTETGEHISSAIKLPPMNDPQKVGSAITYYRRYSLQSLLGLQAEDDDANKASGKEEKKPKSQEPTKELKTDSEEWKKLVKSVENGASFTLNQIKKKYKISQEVKQALNELNIF